MKENNLKQKLQTFSVELSDKISIQRIMANEFEDIGEVEVAHKIRILTRAYADCLIQ